MPGRTTFCRERNKPELIHAIAGDFPARDAQNRDIILL
jgi:hypothetical protein